MVVVGISRPLRLSDGMLREILKRDGNGLLLLRIVAFAYCFRILVDNHVGIHAVVFDVPLGLR